MSLLLNNEWDKEYVKCTLQLDSKCNQTKKTQPHKSQTSISSFFGKGNNACSNGIALDKSKAKKHVSEGESCSNKNDSSNISQLTKVASSLSSTSSKSASTSTTASKSTSTSTSTKKPTSKRKSTDQGKDPNQNKKGTIFGYFQK